MPRKGPAPKRPIVIPQPEQKKSHALRWTGSAASVVDLHPAGFDASEALATQVAEGLNMSPLPPPQPAATPRTTTEPRVPAKALP